MEFNAIVEVDAELGEDGSDVVDAVLSRLGRYHAVVGSSAAGRMRVTVTLEAGSLEAATSEAISAVGAAAGAPVRALEVLPTVDFDAL